MIQRRKLLSALTRARLLELAAGFDVSGLSGKTKDEIVAAIDGARSIKTADLLALLGRNELKSLCRAFYMDDGGREKQTLVDRLLGRGAPGPATPETSQRGPQIPSAERGTRSASTTVGDQVMAKQAPPDQRAIEQYDHRDKTRANNPPVGLVTPATDPDLAKKTYQYDPHLDPQLVWAGKAEHTSFEVQTVSLHVHERIDPRTIIRAVQRQEENRDRWQQLSLFESQAEYLPLRQAVEFYKHPHGWSNRLIAGDSLVVMNSLLQKEGMAGKVQMVYIDPPYGIRYGSNFQPFVNKREVKDGSDADLTQEPEMIRAFRDTWELGIHSYLSYLRDRLLLARELLHESGSCFVQIGDENIHLARSLMDEVFGRDNLVSLVAFVKTSSATSERLAGICDYIVWYAKDIGALKYRQLYWEKKLEEHTDGSYDCVESPDAASWRRMTAAEKADPTLIPVGWRPFMAGAVTSSRPPGSFPVVFGGKSYTPS